MFKKILFPTDDSVHSKNAMSFLEDLAVKYNAEVIILHSYYLPESFNGKPSSHYAYLTEVEKRMIDNGANILKSVKNELEAKKVKVRTILEKGQVGPVIVAKAQSEGCDLIVMGSRGIGGVTSLLISSASNYTVHHAKCPVLMVH